jgi:hypothetical protein
MTLQEIINTGIGTALAAIGWVARILYESVNKLRQDVDNHKLHVSEMYVKKSEMDNLRAEMDKRFDKLETLLARLFDKIDAKADK